MSLRQHEEEELGKDYDLLKKLEKQLRFEDNVRTQGKLEDDIEEIKQRIRKRETELNSLETNPVQSKNQLILSGCELLKQKNFKLAEEKFDEARRTDNQSPEPWYWKARVALAKDNKSVALGYIDKSLQLDSSHISSLVLQIKILLLMGGKYRLEAKEIVSQIRGRYDILGSWLDCLEKENIFSSIVVTSDELERKCPSPIDEGKIV